MTTLYKIEKIETGDEPKLHLSSKDDEIGNPYPHEVYELGETIARTNLIFANVVEETNEMPVSATLRAHGNQDYKDTLAVGDTFSFISAITINPKKPYGDEFKKHIRKAVKQYTNKDFIGGNETLLQIIPLIDTCDEKRLVSELIERNYGFEIGIDDLIDYIAKGGVSHKVKRFFDTLSELPDDIKHMFFRIDLHPWFDYNELLDPESEE